MNNFRHNSYAWEKSAKNEFNPVKRNKNSRFLQLTPWEKSANMKTEFTPLNMVKISTFVIFFF